MSRKIALFCALIGLVAFVASSAYAEVQNIKVSGDITAMGVYRENYDLEDSRNFYQQGDVGSASWYKAEDTDSLFMSVVRLRVDADLTDNVGATIRLANIRDWDDDCASSNDIILDLAYVTLKEMLYSPLTLIIGRQELNYGNGLIVGPGLYRDDSSTTAYRDLSPLHAYDAIRGILDYDPWTLDLVLVKMSESDDDATHVSPLGGRDSDTDLYGVNLAYKFDRYDAEMEGYLWHKRDENYALTIVGPSTSPNHGRTYDDNHVWTSGLRGSVVPMENLTLMGEVAGQWGEISDQEHGGSQDDTRTIDRSGMAANVAGEYNLADIRFHPVLGLEYLYTSGEEYDSSGDFDAWHPIYRGKIMGTIRDCLENLYPTLDNNDSSGWTNQHTVKVSGSLDLGELVDGLSMDMAYLHYWFDEVPISGEDDEIGGEINMKLTYDYTEDVQFAVDSACFITGDYYNDNVHSDSSYMYGGEISTGTQNNADRVHNDVAISVVGSCRVAF